MSIRTEARFPPLSGETLDGRALELPDEFDAPLNLVFVTFGRGRRPATESWLSIAGDLAASYPGVRYYRLSIIDRRYAPAKPLVDRRMRSERSADDRQRAVTVYTDPAVVRRALDVDDDEEDAVHAFLVDRDGLIYWRAEGSRTEDAAERLRRTVRSLAR